MSFNKYRKPFRMRPFSKKSPVNNIFMSQKTVGYTLFTDECVRNIFLTGDSMCFYSNKFFFFRFTVANLCSVYFQSFFFLLKHILVEGDPKALFNSYHREV